MNSRRYTRGTISFEGQDVFVSFDRGGKKVKVPLHTLHHQAVMELKPEGREFDFEIRTIRSLVKSECKCNSVSDFVKCEHYVGPPINDCVYGEPGRVETAFLVDLDSPAFMERIGELEFANVGDEGLFPNHTDKDIWISGFVAGFQYYRKNHKSII